MIRKLIAEFIGTFGLLFAGVGAVALFDKGGLVGVAFAHGLAIAVMGTALGSISGGHFNPAVSIAFGLTKRMSWSEIPGYILAQCLGAAAAVAALMLTGDGPANAHYGVPALTGIGMGAGVGIEIILSFFLGMAIIGTAVDDKAPKLGAWLIGMVIVMDIFAAGPITGAAMNPARWLGPAIFAKDFSGVLVYTLGPIIGIALAFFTHDFLKNSSEAS